MCLMLIQRSRVDFISTIRYPPHDLWDYKRNYLLQLGIAEWENEVCWWEGCRNSAVEAWDSWQRAWDGSSQSDVTDSRTDHRGKTGNKEIKKHLFL